MSDVIDIEVAAKNFNNGVQIKETLIRQLQEKYPKMDVPGGFPEGNFRECEQAVESLLKRNDPGAAEMIADQTRRYEKHLEACKTHSGRFRRYLEPPRERSPEEIRRRKLSKLVKDIGAGRLTDMEEYLDRRDEIFGSAAPLFIWQP